MDINSLFTEQGMRVATEEWRDQHMQDHNQYGQLADIVQRRLEQTPVEGDKRFSARRRARKVARHVKAMQRASRKAAASAEALNAAFKFQVLELPERREIAASKKAERRQQRAVTAGAFVAKSLEKTSKTLAGQTSPQVEAAQEQVEAAPQYLDPQPFTFPVAAGAENQGPVSISDYFQGGRR